MTRLSVERLDELRRHATEAPEYMGGCLDLLGHIDAMETELTDLRTRLLVMTRERDEALNAGRRFPVIRPLKTDLVIPETIPWSRAETFREAAKRNHGQTLERLAERGGMDPTEIWAAAHQKRLREACSLPEAVAWLTAVLTTGADVETYKARALDAEAAMSYLRERGGALLLVTEIDQFGHSDECPVSNDGAESACDCEARTVDAFAAALALPTPDLATTQRREWEARGIEEAAKAIVDAAEARASATAGEGWVGATYARDVALALAAQKRQGGGT